MKRAALLIAELEARGVLPEAEAIARGFGVGLVEAFGDNRYPASVAVRQRVWVHMHDQRSPSGERIYSTSAIARVFGVDHTTVIHGLRRARSGRTDQRLSTRSDTP